MKVKKVVMVVRLVEESLGRENSEIEKEKFKSSWMTCQLFHGLKASKKLL